MGGGAVPRSAGRFYNPARPEFGPPHASSTGVYLEGLIDAYRLATEGGDEERAERYRLAIRRGLRSVMQLQFQDAVDLYYVEEPARVRGGVRTELYDDVIRVDNVQHNLLAVLKISETFASADYGGERDITTPLAWRRRTRVHEGDWSPPGGAIAIGSDA